MGTPVNNVPPGYKQTEVGVIPEEWNVETIGELIEGQTILGHLDGNHGELYPRSHEFKPYGVPYIGANDFDEGDVTFERCKFLSAERASKFRKGVAKDGDVLFAHNATVGPVALLRTSVPFVILSTTATYFRCNPEKLNNSYLKGALQSSHFVKQYQAVMAQSTRFQVPITAQRKLSLVIPPLPEQRAIATALSDVDALLDALDRLIAKKRDLKQAAMQQLLTGQTRLPSFHGEWEVKRMEHAGRCLRGVSYQGDSDLSTHDTAHTKRLLRSNNVQDAVVVTSEVQFVNAERVSPSQVLKENDILICMANGSKALVGKAGLFAVNDGYDYTFGAFMGCFRTDSTTANPPFVFSLFHTGRYRDYINNLLAGSSINNLRPSSIESLEFSFPPLPEQTAIAAVLTDMDAELTALEQRREKTRALKQGMMQELLTGRIRLVEPRRTARGAAC